MSSADFKASPASSEFSQKTFSTQMDLRKLYLRSLPLSILYCTVQVPPEKPNCLQTSVPLTVLFSRLYYRVCSLLCALERFIFQTRNKETCSRTNLESEVISTETISTDRTFMCIYKMLLEENPTVLKQFYNTFLHFIQ